MWQIVCEGRGIKIRQDLHKPYCPNIRSLSRFQFPTFPFFDQHLLVFLGNDRRIEVRSDIGFTFEKQWQCGMVTG